MRKLFLPLDNMLKIKGYKNDAQLAEEYGWPQSTVASWRSRGSIPFKKVIAFCNKEGISPEQILAGKGFNLYDIKPPDQQMHVAEEGVEYPDSSPAQSDITPVVDVFIKSFGEMIGYLAKRLDAVGSRLNALELAVKECQEWRQRHEKREETFPHKPAASAGDTKKKAM